MSTHPNGGYVVVKHDEDFKWFNTQDYAVWECNYPDGLIFVLGAACKLLLRYARQILESHN